MNRKQHRRKSRSRDHRSARLKATHMIDLSQRIMSALAQALRHHHAGEFRAAETCYREILALDPNHLDSLHLLGVLSHQLGRHREAIRSDWQGDRA